MQMSLVMSMQFILTMTKMTHSVDHVLAHNELHGLSNQKNPSVSS